MDPISLRNSEKFIDVVLLLVIIMINPVDIQNLNEPFEIREWSKSKLYTHISETFFVASRDSRGMNRSQLVRIYTAQVYRVTRQDMLQFEANLQPAETRKSTFYCVSLLYERLQTLMELMNLPPLGYPEGTVPEEEWFTRILRYIDRYNLLEGFQRRLQGAEPPRLFLSRV